VYNTNLALVGLTKHISPININFTLSGTFSSNAHKHVWDLLSVSYQAWWCKRRRTRNVVCSSTSVLLTTQ
jgi:hypothetical protein